MHSFPSRKTRNTFSNKRQSLDERRRPLQISTSISQEIERPTSPNRVRQRLSSLFSSSSPVLFGFGNKKKMESTPTLDMLVDDDESASDSDHAPHSPDVYSTDRHIKSVEHDFWQVPSTTTIVSPDIAPVKQVNYSALVRQVLGSAVAEVDEEIDRDWEVSRNELCKSLSSKQRHCSAMF
jgi:hypothetical protein